MLAILKPQQNFEISANDLFDINMNQLNAEIKIEQLDDSHINLTIDNLPTIKIWKGHIDAANENGQYIKIDPSKSTRVRKIYPDKIADLTKSVSASELVEAFDPNKVDIVPTLLKDIKWDPKLFKPWETGTYLDKYWSRKGGILPGTNTMITGDPGIGKSSNMMEILTKLKDENPEIKVAYVSAEMEPEDLQEFLQFYPGLDEVPFLFLADYMYEDDGIPVWQVLSGFLAKGYDVVVFDSLIEVQTIIQEELGLSAKKGEAWMLKFMRGHNKGYNQTNSYTATLSIQQKNKSGQYVGSKRLEHMTTAFLQLLWDGAEKGKRYMVFEKNRKGKEKVKLYYGFTDGDGIKYDTDRHRIELDILEALQNGSGENLIEEIGTDGFDSIFNEIKE